MSARIGVDLYSFTGLFICEQDVPPDEIEAAIACVPGFGEICTTSLQSTYAGELVAAAAEGGTGDWQAEAARRLAVFSCRTCPRPCVEIDALPSNK